MLEKASSGVLVFILLAGCLATNEGEPSWEQIGDAVAGGPSNNASATNGTAQPAENASGGQTVTPPQNDSGNASGGGPGPVVQCGTVQVPSPPTFNAELTACQAACGALPPEVKNMCTNSCYMRAVNSTGNAYYCTILSMPQLSGRCFSIAALAKKDKCICSLAKDPAKRAECEALYENPVR